MLTGRCAFRGTSTISTLTAVLRDDIEPIAQLKPDVPFELERIVETCLKKDPAQRYQSMREIQSALAPLKRQSDSGALDIPTVRGIMPLPPLPPRAAKPRASKALVIGAVCVLVAACAGAGGYWWMTRHGSAQPATQSQPSSTPIGTAAPAPDAPLTNDNILQMVQAKVAPDVILSQIRASKTNFDLSSAEVIRLSKAGVPANVIEAMFNPKAAPAPDKAVATASNPAAGAASGASATDLGTVPLQAPITVPVVLGDAFACPRLILAQDIPGDASEGDPVAIQGCA